MIDPGKESPKRYRPTSLYVLVAIAVLLFLGLFLAYGEHTPKELVLYVGLFLVFFIAAIVVALSDVREILVGFLKEKRHIYRRTIGDSDFKESLKKALSEESKKDEE